MCPHDVKELKVDVLNNLVMVSNALNICVWQLACDAYSGVSNCSIVTPAYSRGLKAYDKIKPSITVKAVMLP